VIRFADARLSESTRIRLSIIHWLMGVVNDWMTKASEPRTDSSDLMNVSPFAKSRAVVAVTVTPMCEAISSASSG
jgi:hypothetical protein